MTEPKKSEAADEPEVDQAAERKALKENADRVEEAAGALGRGIRSWVEVKKAKNGQFVTHVVTNGEITYSSEPHKNRVDAVAAAVNAFPNLPIRDLTQQ